jgi:hypothetical protein
MYDEFESNGESENPENGEEKKKYRIPDHLLNLNPDRRQRLINLHIWCSREKFFKLQRQRMKNFIASLKKNLKKMDLEFSKIYILEEEITKVQKIIDEIEKEIALELTGLPIWERFMKNVKGLGEPTAGIIISKIGDIARFHSISALRKYSGWYPQDGKAVRKTMGSTAGFSVHLHQTLYHWGEAILKANDPHYRPMYDNFKAKIREKHPEWNDRKATKGKKIEGIPMHIHRMAMRKTIQMFLSDLFCIWRDLEGLEQTKPYAVEVLGHEGFIDPLKNPYYEKPEGG